MFGIGIQELVMLFFIFGLPLIFWLWALVDIVKSEFSGSNKVIWLLVVIFIPIIGFTLYFLVGRKQKIRRTGAA